MRRRSHPGRPFPTSERSLLERRHYQDHLTIDRTELLAMIRGGEDSYVELKVRLSNPETVAAEAIAMANCGGGFIVFGVNDQRRVEGVDDPERLEQQLVEICQQRVQPPLRPLIDKLGFDNGRRIVALEITGTRRPYFSSDRRCYVRVGSVKREATLEEISDMYDPRRSVGFESIPVDGATLDDIDEALLWSYVRELRGGSVSDFEAREYPLAELLQRHLSLATERTHDVVPTLAGLLLFGKRSSVEKRFPRAGMLATRIGGLTGEDASVESLELIGNLASVYERALQFIRRYATLSTDARSPTLTHDRTSPVPPRPSFSQPAVLEALANALLHRDYSLRDGVTRLWIFDDRIEISNPSRTEGRRLEPLYCGVVSNLYPRLKAVFKSRFYGLEIAHGGIPALLKNAQDHSGLRPEFRMTGDEFRIRLHGAR
ncbi:MAG: putative DNA binding domain-containing protein [Acidobacteria bacterium]|nr:putative DNA binding domain-containing protein [Acidobacteriota bacterium]